MAVTKKADAKVLTSTSKVWLKKHKGKPVEDVIKEDPAYLIWIQENVDFLIVAPEVLARCQDVEVHTEITYTTDREKLGEMESLVTDIYNGIDVIGTNGVREVHGLEDGLEPQIVLHDVRQLLRFLKQEADAGRPLTIPAN